MRVLLKHIQFNGRIEKFSMQRIANERSFLHLRLPKLLLNGIKLQNLTLLRRKYSRLNIFFTFTYPCNGRESIVFGSIFSKGVFDEFTRFEVS